MATTMKLIAKQTLGSNAADITFSDIPQTGYTDLLVIASARSARTVFFADNMNVQFNGSTSGYSWRYLEGNGSSASSVSGSSQSQILACYTPTAAATVDTFGVASIYIPNYAGSTNKSISAESVTERNGTDSFIVASAGLWANTAAITSVKVISQVANFVTGSSFFLYGITKA